MLKLRKRARGHFVTLIEISVDLNNRLLFPVLFVIRIQNRCNKAFCKKLMYIVEVWVIDESEK